MTPNINRSPRERVYVGGAIALCAAVVAGILAQHRWSDVVAEQYGWAAPWLIYGAGGLTVAFVALLYLTDELELDRFIFRDPSMIPLSTSEQLRIMGLCSGIAGGAVAMSIPVDLLLRFDPSSGEATLLGAAVMVWVMCSGALMGSSWEDWSVAYERKRRQEEAEKARRRKTGRQARVGALRRWFQPKEPVGAAGRVAREWLILVGFMTLSGVWHAFGDGSLLGALYGVGLYLLALPVRLTVWSIKKVFNSQGTRQGETGNPE